MHLPSFARPAAPVRSRRVATAVGCLLLLCLAAGPVDARTARPHGTPHAATKPESSTPYRNRPELRAFAAEVAQRQGWEPAWVMAQLAGARRLPRVARLIMPPATPAAKNWQAYRDRFVEPRRIDAGVAFWQANAATLARAEAEFGVPADVVVGIIGVETFYGRITGDFRVLDALATLAFDFPAGRSDRSAFFRSELEELLVLARREGVRADSLRGSYAGAIGWPQFLPGSINRHAIDYDGDGHVDLQRSLPDVIGSVAHYLQAHGWQRGLATHHAVQPHDDDAARAALLEPDIKPSFSAAQFSERGAQLDEAGRRHEGSLALVQLHNGGAAPSYVAGTQNFWAVTRYNWSAYYAMAVITLGEAVKAARPPVTAATPPSTR